MKAYWEWRYSSTAFLMEVSGQLIFFYYVLGVLCSKCINVPIMGPDFTSVCPSVGTFYFETDKRI